MAKDERYEVSKVYPGPGAGQYSNIIGPESDPQHGHVVVTETGNTVYARDYGENKK